MMAKEMSKTEKTRQLFADKALDVEQMDEVAGGAYAETANDSRFLNVLLRGHPAQCDRYGEKRLELEYNSDYKAKINEIRNAWAACGVQCAFKTDGPNHYFINDKEVTQGVAMAHAMKVMGKRLTQKDWYWD